MKFAKKKTTENSHPAWDYRGIKVYIFFLFLHKKKKKKKKKKTYVVGTH